MKNNSLLCMFRFSLPFIIQRYVFFVLFFLFNFFPKTKDVFNSCKAIQYIPIFFFIFGILVIDSVFWNIMIYQGILRF